MQTNEQKKLAKELNAAGPRPRAVYQNRPSRRPTAVIGDRKSTPADRADTLSREEMRAENDLARKRARATSPAPGSGSTMSQLTQKVGETVGKHKDKIHSAEHEMKGASQALEREIGGMGFGSH